MRTLEKAHHFGSFAKISLVLVLWRITQVPILYGQTISD
jgi:hypothetical protein